MFSHVFVSVSDFEHALHFYRAVMGSLGVELRFCERERPWAGLNREAFDLVDGNLVLR